MFKTISLLMVCSVAVMMSTPGTPLYDLKQADQLFEEFIKTYKRQYRNEDERQKRFEIFQDNLKDINARNTRSKTATFGINKFVDITIEEFLQQYSCLKPTLKDSKCPAAKNISRGLPPASFDWRDKKKVTRVKDQGSCGSCWAFSVTGNLEGQYAIKHNQLKEFSEEQLVECDLDDSGCMGGYMAQAMAWVRDHGGIMSEQDYPYTGNNGRCKFDKNKVVATVSGCHSFHGTSEEELKNVLVSTGPLSIGVSANFFTIYQSGILDDCPVARMNHGVLLVGYGKENGTAYWIVKNSWGEDWGENGYIRLKMNINACNMTGYINSAVVN